ncbi:hypothetical protein BHM03_00012775 [Ensete ventricosum]|nr:hypothetical protein BHM03_00012775 [Ensete ventricosum]
MAQAVEEWYKQMPIITRSYLTAAVVTTVGCSLEVRFFSLPSIFLLDSNGIISPHNLYLNPKLIVQQYEIWRLVTNFLYFRKMGRWCKRSISVNRVRVIDLVVILLLTFLCDRFYWGSLFLLAAVRGWTSWYAT